MMKYLASKISSAGKMFWNSPDRAFYSMLSILFLTMFIAYGIGFFNRQSFRQNIPVGTTTEELVLLKGQPDRKTAKGEEIWYLDSEHQPLEKWHYDLIPDWALLFVPEHLRHATIVLENDRVIYLAFR
ncbi:MAG: hypothetical protein HUJ26_22785 [Planctomycetaceae bacterium]|nr:hypothetical protein [Planctomycetaceae bacterium]